MTHDTCNTSCNTYSNTYSTARSMTHDSATSRPYPSSTLNLGHPHSTLCTSDESLKGRLKTGMKHHHAIAHVTPHEAFIMKLHPPVSCHPTSFFQVRFTVRPQNTVCTVDQAAMLPILPVCTVDEVTHTTHYLARWMRPLCSLSFLQTLPCCLHTRHTTLLPPHSTLLPPHSPLRE